MSEYIAVSGLTLSHGEGSPITGGAFTVVSLASNKTKESGKGIYISPLLYTFAGGSAPGHSPGSVTTSTSQSINATSQKTKDYGILVIRENDSGTMTCAGSAGAISGPVKISAAGQTKVIGE